MENEMLQLLSIHFIIYVRFLYVFATQKYRSNKEINKKWFLLQILVLLTNSILDIKKVA